MKRAKVKEGFRIDYIGIGLISLGLGSMQIILDKGEREDWLSSGFIQVFFALMVIGIIAGIIWELREEHPVVDLRMLKDRNFAVATLAMFFLGFVLYASTVLIPQFLQQMMGYTAELAGLALSPGGAVIMFMMPVVGILISRVNSKYLIAFGCTISALSLFVMAGWNLQIDYKHAVLARMMQSFGLAFLFIPINVSAFSFVPKDRKSTRLNSSHLGISYAVFCLKKKKLLHAIHCLLSFFFYGYVDHRDLHSFPTRRSSDLFGCTISALSLFVMAGWNLQIDYKHAVLARMMQSFGLAFLFIPINVSAFSFVPKEKTNMGTGIINLERNIGANVEISTDMMILQRYR